MVSPPPQRRIAAPFALAVAPMARRAAQGCDAALTEKRYISAGFYGHTGGCSTQCSGEAILALLSRMCSRPGRLTCRCHRKVSGRHSFSQVVSTLRLNAPQAAASSRMLIEFQGPPTLRRLPPGAELVGASELRVSAATAAADDVKEEHLSFRRAAAGIAMTEHHVFQHVRACSCAPGAGR